VAPTEQPTDLEHLVISAQNLIGLIGGIALIIYLFFALTHPHKF
jgi:K+-transporting ATPase KdpF subunit